MKKLIKKFKSGDRLNSFWAKEMRRDQHLWNDNYSLPTTTPFENSAVNNIVDIIPDYALRYDFYNYLENNGGLSSEMVDDSMSDKDKVNRFLELYNGAKRPIIKFLDSDDELPENGRMPGTNDLRSYYRPELNTMYISPNTYSKFDSNILAELIHAYQYYNPDTNNHWLTPSAEKMEKQNQSNADTKDSNGMDAYDRLGNLEYNGHFIIQPVVEDYVLGRKQKFLQDKSITDFSNALGYYTQQAVSRFRNEYPEFEDPYSSFKLTNTDKVRMREHNIPIYKFEHKYDKHVEPDWDVLDRMGFSTPYNGMITKQDMKHFNNIDFGNMFKLND